MKSFNELFGIKLNSTPQPKKDKAKRFSKESNKLQKILHDTVQLMIPMGFGKFTPTMEREIKALQKDAQKLHDEIKRIKSEAP